MPLLSPSGFAVLRFQPVRAEASAFVAEDRAVSGCADKSRQTHLERCLNCKGGASEVAGKGMRSLHG